MHALVPASGLDANAIVLGAAVPTCGSVADSSCLSSGAKAAAIITSAALAGVCAASAVSGFGYANRCQHTRDLNALCITGDLGACRQLVPGWIPPGPYPYPGPPPPPPPPPGPRMEAPPPGAPPEEQKPPASDSPRADPQLWSPPWAALSPAPR
jgi:hypothetical protein